jgi:YD repeat-containing protein
MTNISQKFGTGKSHPVDVAGGHFYTDNTDFSFPGVIPFEFRRQYFSYNYRQGSLGTGWSHPYDMALALDREENLAVVRLDDGRTTGFRIPSRNGVEFNRREKLWLHRDAEDGFYMSDREGLLYRFTGKEYKNPFTRSECNLLQSVSNRNGYSLRFDYGRDGVLTRVTDTAGRVFDITTDGKGHIATVIAPSARAGDKPEVISRYTYDADGRLTSQTDAQGAVMRFEYDGTLMTKETWRNGLNWTVRYSGGDHTAKCIEITGDANLFHYRFHYVSPDCTLVTDSLGIKTAYYHKDGVVTRRTDPNGGEWEYRYNPYTELEWTTDPMGNCTGRTQDEWGNTLTQTAPDGGFTLLAYDNLELPYLPTAATDAAGGKWAWSYDKRGNLIRRKDPMITGAQGEKTHLEYDRHGNLVKAVSPDGGVNRWRYDELGQCLWRENAKRGITEYEYNRLGDVIRVKEEGGNICTLEYDVTGNVIRARDNDRDVRFTYCGVNKLASRSERGATLRFLYDTEDRLKAVVNESGERYTFELDAQGNVEEETGFDGIRRSYIRDLAGKVAKVFRPGGQETWYEYDPADRIAKVIYNPKSDSKCREESYEYRRDGLLVKAVNRDAEVILERDVLGRVIKETCNGLETVSKYDISGNRVQITSSLGADIHAEYNIMGDVISLSGGGWQTQYTRDLFGGETARSIAGGITSRSERDRRGRVISQKIEKNNRYITEKSYLWSVNDKLLGVITDGEEKIFSCDDWDFFARRQTANPAPDCARRGNVPLSTCHLPCPRLQTYRLHRRKNRLRQAEGTCFSCNFRVQ